MKGSVEIREGGFSLRASASGEELQFHLEDSQGRSIDHTVRKGGASIAMAHQIGREIERAFKGAHGIALESYTVSRIIAMVHRCIEQLFQAKTA